MAGGGLFLQKSSKILVCVFLAREPEPCPKFVLLFYKNYFFLHGSFFAACQLSLIAVSRSNSLVAVQGLLIEVTSLIMKHRL